MKKQLANRRGFVGASSMALLGTLFSSHSAGMPFHTGMSDLPENFPQTPPDQARAIVGASHARIDTVKALLKENKALAKASWDWGFGDWETAIGAASHTGRREIIELLMANGARPTLFSFAALDKVAAVRAICTNIPDAHRTLGPHGITLYQHAINGRANKVIDYLDSIEGADVGPGRSIAKDEAKPFLGTYQFGANENERFNVIIGKSIPRIAIETPGSIMRYMALVKPNTFVIYGAEQVEIRFQMQEDQATSLTIIRGSFRLEAKRV